MQISHLYLRHKVEGLHTVLLLSRAYKLFVQGSGCKREGNILEHSRYKKSTIVGSAKGLFLKQEKAIARKEKAHARLLLQGIVSTLEQKNIFSAWHIVFYFSLTIAVFSQK